MFGVRCGGRVGSFNLAAPVPRPQADERHHDQRVEEEPDEHLANDLHGMAVVLAEGRDFLPVEFRRRHCTRLRRGGG